MDGERQLCALKSVAQCVWRVALTSDEATWVLCEGILAPLNRALLEDLALAHALEGVALDVMREAGEGHARTWQRCAAMLARGELAVGTGCMLVLLALALDVDLAVLGANAPGDRVVVLAACPGASAGGEQMRQRAVLWLHKEHYTPLEVRADSALAGEIQAALDAAQAGMDDAGLAGYFQAAVLFRAYLARERAVPGQAAGPVVSGDDVQAGKPTPTPAVGARGKVRWSRMDVAFSVRRSPSSLAAGKAQSPRARARRWPVEHTQAVEHMQAAAPPTPRAAASSRKAPRITVDDVNDAAAAMRAYFDRPTALPVREFCASVAAVGVVGINKIFMAELANAVSDGELVHSAVLASLLDCMRAASMSSPPDGAQLRVANAPRAAAEAGSTRSIVNAILGELGPVLKARGVQLRVDVVNAGTPMHVEVEGRSVTYAAFHDAHWTVLAPSATAMPSPGIALVVSWQQVAMPMREPSEHDVTDYPDDDTGTGIQFPHLCEQTKLKATAALLDKYTGLYIDTSYLLHKELAKAQRRALVARDKGLAAAVLAAALAHAVSERRRVLDACGKRDMPIHVLVERAYAPKVNTAARPMNQQRLAPVVQRLRAREPNPAKWTHDDVRALVDAAGIDVEFRLLLVQWLNVHLRGVNNTSIVLCGGEADCHVAGRRDGRHVLFEGRDGDLYAWLLLLGDPPCTIARWIIPDDAVMDAYITASTTAELFAEVEYMSAEDKQALRGHQGLPLLLLAALLGSDYNDGQRGIGPKRVVPLVVNALKAALQRVKPSSTLTMSNLIDALKMDNASVDVDDVDKTVQAMAWMPLRVNDDRSFELALPDHVREALIGRDHARPTWFDDHIAATHVWMQAAQQAPLASAGDIGFSLGAGVDEQVGRIRAAWALAEQTGDWATVVLLTKALAIGLHPDRLDKYKPEDFDGHGKFPDVTYVRHGNVDQDLKDRVLADFMSVLNMDGPDARDVVDLNMVARLLMTLFFKSYVKLQGTTKINVTSKLAAMHTFWSTGLKRGKPSAPYSTSKKVRASMSDAERKVFAEFHALFKAYPLERSSGKASGLRAQRLLVLRTFVATGMASTVPLKSHNVTQNYANHETPLGVHVAHVLAATIVQLSLHKMANMARKATSAHGQPYRVRLRPWQEQRGRAELVRSASRNVVRLLDDKVMNKGNVHVIVAELAGGSQFKLDNTGHGQCTVSSVVDATSLQQRLGRLADDNIVYVVAVRGVKQDKAGAMGTVRAAIETCSTRAVIQAWDFFTTGTTFSLHSFTDAAHDTELNDRLLAPLQRALRSPASRSSPSSAGEKRRKANDPAAVAMDIEDDDDVATTHAKPTHELPVEPPDAKRQNRAAQDTDVAGIVAAMEHPPAFIDSCWALAVDVAHDLVTYCPNARVGGATYRDLILAQRDGANALFLQATVAKISLGVCEYLHARLARAGDDGRTWSASVTKLTGETMPYDAASNCTSSKLFSFLQHEGIASLRATVCLSASVSAMVELGLHDTYMGTGDVMADVSLFRAHGKDTALRTAAPATTVRRIVDDILHRCVFVCTRERSSALASALEAKTTWMLIPSSIDETRGLPAQLLVARATLSETCLWWYSAAGWYASSWDKAASDCKGKAVSAIFVPALFNNVTLLQTIKAVAAQVQGGFIRLLTSRIAIADSAAPPNTAAFAWLDDFAKLFDESDKESYLFKRGTDWQAGVVGPSGAIHVYSSAKDGCATRTRIKQGLDFHGRVSAPRPTSKLLEQKTKKPPANVLPRRVGRIEAVMGRAFGAPTEDTDFVERVQVVMARFSTPSSRSLSAAVVLESPLLKTWFTTYIES